MPSTEVSLTGATGGAAGLPLAARDGCGATLVAADDDAPEGDGADAGAASAAAAGMSLANDGASAIRADRRVSLANRADIGLLNG